MNKNFENAVDALAAGVTMKDTEKASLSKMVYRAIEDVCFQIAKGNPAIESPLECAKNATNALCSVSLD